METIIHQPEPCQRTQAWEEFNEKISIQLGMLRYDFCKQWGIMPTRQPPTEANYVVNR